MSKTIKNTFYQKLTFEKFLEAHKRASKNKRYKKEVLIFELDLESNLINLINKIKNGSYQMGEYKTFTIYEPKERLIKKLPYVDRIVHQWDVGEFIKDYIVARFISDSYACINNRGTHKAILKLQSKMRIMKQKYNNYYIIKCDIKKYFDHIDKNILFDILTRYISDQYLLVFTKKLIFDNDNLVALPIGNYTSQYFANIYLNELDYYIKHKLKIKHYIRYLDDFVLLVKDKKEAKKVLAKISIFLSGKLKLTLNKKINYFPNKLGIDFCGYKVYETHILIRKRCKIKTIKNIKKWNKLYLSNKLDEKQFILSYNSFLGHIKHSNSYNLRNKYERMFLFDIDDKYKQKRLVYQPRKTEDDENI